MARKIPELDPRRDLEAYTGTALRNADIWTPEKIRSEYSRLRSIARKRLERLEVKEPESYAYRYNKDRYKPVAQMSVAQMRAELTNLAKFITAKTGTVRGIEEQRRKAIAKLTERGYTGVTAGNLRQFGKYMESWRDLSKQVMRKGSPTAVELFEFIQEHDIPWEVVNENFER